MVTTQKMLVVCALLVAFTASMGWSEEPVSQPSMKRSEARRLMKSAQTSKDFMSLAAYFDAQAKMYDQKSREENAELEHLLNTRYKTKIYPTLVSFAQAGRDLDRSQAEKYLLLAKTYQLRAGDSLGL